MTPPNAHVREQKIARKGSTCADETALFPPMHVDHATGPGSGPRAPPRNKMALYELVTTPSKRSRTITSGSSVANSMNPIQSLGSGVGPPEWQQNLMPLSVAYESRYSYLPYVAHQQALQQQDHHRGLRASNPCPPWSCNNSSGGITSASSGRQGINNGVQGEPVRVTAAVTGQAAVRSDKHVSRSNKHQRSRSTSSARGSAWIGGQDTQIVPARSDHKCQVLSEDALAASDGRYERHGPVIASKGKGNVEKRRSDSSLRDTTGPACRQGNVVLGRENHTRRVRSEGGDSEASGLVTEVTQTQTAERWALWAWKKRHMSWSATVVPSSEPVLSAPESLQAVSVTTLIENRDLQLPVAHGSNRSAVPASLHFVPDFMPMLSEEDMCAAGSGKLSGSGPVAGSQLLHCMKDVNGAPECVPSGGSAVVEPSVTSSGAGLQQLAPDVPGEDQDVSALSNGHNAEDPMSEQLQKQTMGTYKAAGVSHGKLVAACTGESGSGASTEKVALASSTLRKQIASSPVVMASAPVSPIAVVPSGAIEKGEGGKNIFHSIVHSAGKLVGDYPNGSNIAPPQGEHEQEVPPVEREMPGGLDVEAMTGHGISSRSCAAPLSTKYRKLQSRLDAAGPSTSMSVKGDKADSGEGVSEQTPSTAARDDAADCGDSIGEAERTPMVMPTDVVSCIGQQEFWRARKAIFRQQRCHATQVLELHRLVRVQQELESGTDLSAWHIRQCQDDSLASKHFPYYRGGAAVNCLSETLPAALTAAATLTGRRVHAHSVRQRATFFADASISFCADAGASSGISRPPVQQDQLQHVISGPTGNLGPSRGSQWAYCASSFPRSSSCGIMKGDGVQAHHASPSPSPKEQVSSSHAYVHPPPAMLRLSSSGPESKEGSPPHASRRCVPMVAPGHASAGSLYSPYEKSLPTSSPCQVGFRSTELAPNSVPVQQTSYSDVLGTSMWPLQSRVPESVELFTRYGKVGHNAIRSRLPVKENSIVPGTVMSCGESSVFHQPSAQLNDSSSAGMSNCNDSTSYYVGIGSQQRFDSGRGADSSFLLFPPRADSESVGMLARSAHRAQEADLQFCVGEVEENGIRGCTRGPAVAAAGGDHQVPGAEREHNGSASSKDGSGGVSAASGHPYWSRRWTEHDLGRTQHSLRPEGGTAAALGILPFTCGRDANRDVGQRLKFAVCGVEENVVSNYAHRSRSSCLDAAAHCSQWPQDSQNSVVDDPATFCKAAYQQEHVEGSLVSVQEDRLHGDDHLKCRNKNGGGCRAPSPLGELQLFPTRPSMIEIEKDEAFAIVSRGA